MLGAVRAVLSWAAAAKVTADPRGLDVAGFDRGWPNGTPAPLERIPEKLNLEGEPTGEPVGALVYWIWRITEPGAPLVPILNVPHAPGPGCMPLVAQSLSLASAASRVASRQAG